ncbi:MAG: FHA domain-containing protein [Kiritimatiellae bacterium]|nr:FHA domain-containing protein [Kiritimatiellia bacterium]
MLYRFIVLNGPGKGEQSTLPVDELIIGRDKNCGLTLDDPEVAAQHARVIHTPQGPKISDLGSTNRLLVNKREVREATLRHGDMIEIGRTRLLLQAHLLAEVTDDAEPPLRRGTRGWIRAAAWATILLGVWSVYRLYAPRSEPFLPKPEPVAYVAPEPPVPEPPAPLPEPGPAEPNELSVELRQLREELAEVKQAVRGLASPALPESPPEDQAPKTSEPEPPPTTDRTAASEAELKLAREALASGNRADADARLERLLMEDPGFLPAYAERARLFEQQGELQSAIGQWALLIQQSRGGAMAGMAAEEWARIASSQATQTPAVPEATPPSKPEATPPPEPEPPAPAAPVPAPAGVRFVNLSQRRFPDSFEYDEMRVIRADIACPGARPPDPDALRMEITFFDRMNSTGAIYPTRMMPSTYELGSAGAAWTAGGDLSITTAYVVPRGRRPAGSPEQYYGYRVRLYCNGRLEDEDARPLDLLSYPDSAEPPPDPAKAPAPPDLPEPVV